MGADTQLQTQTQYFNADLSPADQLDLLFLAEKGRVNF